MHVYPSMCGKTHVCMGMELGLHLHALHNYSQMHSKHAQLLGEVTLFTLQDTEE